MRPKLTPYAKELIAAKDAKVRRLVAKIEDIRKESIAERDHRMNPFIGDVTVHISGESFRNCQRQYHG